MYALSLDTYTHINSVRHIKRCDNTVFHHYDVVFNSCMCGSVCNGKDNDVGVKYVGTLILAVIMAIF